MRPHLACVVTDQRGLSLIVAGMGLTAFLACAAIAIDVGEFMTARAQAQNSADAAALAGATALAFDDGTDRSASGPAVTSAVQTGLRNQVLGANVSVGPADVTFLSDPNGVSDRVQVRVYRTSQRGNPIPTWLGGIFGIKTVNIDATATAEASSANAATCVMPFTLPDKWIDHTGPKNCFEAYYQGGSRRPDADTYIPPSPTDAATGYTAALDTGTELRLKPRNEGRTDKVAQPFYYFPIRLPGSTGAADFAQNITICNPSIMKAGDLMTFEPGDMVGPTAEAVQTLIDKDPDAYWDTLRNRVVSSMHPSPRVVAIPLFDPDYYDVGRNTGRTSPDLRVANFVGFFIEEAKGDEIFGRITPIGGLVRGGQPPLGGFPRAVRLVE